MKLATDWDGVPRPGRPVLALLHGLMGSRQSWAPVRDGLRALGATVALELIGHGRSPAPDDPQAYRMDACLDQLEAAWRGLALPPAWWVGYSMGGRVALQLAVRRPHLVAGLVLESATPGLEGETARAERQTADEARAEALLANGVEAFVDDWLAGPLFAGLARLPAPRREAQRALRLKNSAAGLAGSLRGMGTGAMEPVWQRLGEVEVPVLVMAGEKDGKYCAIARRMAEALPRASLTILPGVGHTLHAEAPAAYLAALGEFFGGVEPAA